MVDSNEIPPQGDSGQPDPEASGPVSDATVRSESINASNVSDQATKTDLLGFNPYVEAIAEFLTNEETQPPLTLSIEGEWGSGKSSFMRQLQEEIEQIERREKQPISRKIWFNAWRHDKVEALWAAFALEFFRRISRPRRPAEIIPTWGAYLKLLWMRFKWQENWPYAIRAAALVLFLGGFALSIPLLFLNNVGLDDINLISNQIACRLSPQAEEQDAKEQDAEGPDTEDQEPDAEAQAQGTEEQGVCLEFDPESGNVSEIILSGLLWLGGFGGSATGALALLAQLKKIVGDPKNDLQQYIERPDYEKQVAFIETFHEDFEKIVSAYAGKGNKVYVFIDDLDRCGLTKAADLMQGLNLLISNDPHLIFILAMDREKVVAGIALKQKDVLSYLSSPSVVLNASIQKNASSLKGLEYGYAYIEKFVQLPFQVPKVSGDGLDFFLESLSSKSFNQTFPGNQNLQFFSFFSKWASWVVSNVRLPSSKQIETEPEKQPTNDVSAGDADAQNATSSSSEIIREPKLEIQLSKDSEAIRQVISMVAPTLDYNPRRIKQFINLFRLKVFIAYNTGLFDDVQSLSQGSEDVSLPSTLEQLGKFTALCMQYPLLRVDLEDNATLLADLQRYALASGDSREKYDDTTKYWGRHSKLIDLLCIGCKHHDQEAKPTLDVDLSEPYSLEKVDIKKLLQVSPSVKPIDRVPLRSEKGVDYRTLRALLRAKQWSKADEETYEVMLKAAQREKQRHLEISDIEQFPCKDLQIIDQLWVTASSGQFGFSVQKQIWQEGNSLKKYNAQEKKFGDRVGWRQRGRWVHNTSSQVLQGFFPCRWKDGYYARMSEYLSWSGGLRGIFSRIQTCRL